MVTLEELTFDIDVFNFAGVEDAESSGSLAASGIFGTEENHITPQANITSLPNRTLNGLWDSYVTHLL